MNSVRVAVIGTSRFTERVHLANLSSHPQVELVALCGRNPKRAAELASLYYIPHIYPDYRQMIEAGGIDAVVVVAPDDLHYPMTMHALNAGLHVLCDKPLALNSLEARVMLENAGARGLVHMTYFSTRAVPEYRFLHDRLAQNAIGQIYSLNLRYSSGWARDGAYNWRWDASRANGAVADLGAHLIDLARWLAGDIVRVSGLLGAYVPRRGPDGQLLESPANDKASLLVEFANGAQGLLQMSAIDDVGDHGLEHRLSLHGSDGTAVVEIDWDGAARMCLVHGDAKGYEPLTTPSEYWAGAPESGTFADRLAAINRVQPVNDRYFVDCILAGKPATPSFAEGLAVQQVIDAAIESHRSGVAVEIQSS